MWAERIAFIMVNSIRKGKRAEREIVNILKDSGVPAKRIGGMETNHVDKGDVELNVMGVFKAQVKSGSHVPVTLYKFLEHEDLAFVRRDRSEWLVCMKLDFFLEKFI